MGLPRLDFRVPEGKLRDSALATKIADLLDGRFHMPAGFSSAGSLALPYKIAVVAVMALVACGTLVTFGTAGAETPAASTETAVLPGTTEASPQVQGQVIANTPVTGLTPDTSVLSSDDLLTSLDLKDYSPSDTSRSSNSDSKKKSKSQATATPTPKPKKSTSPTTKATSKPNSSPTTKPSTKPTSSPTSKAPDPVQTTKAPDPSPTTKAPDPVCHDEKVWVPASGSVLKGNFKPGHYETKQVCN